MTGLRTNKKKRATLATASASPQETRNPKTQQWLGSSTCGEPNSNCTEQKPSTLSAKRKRVHHLSVPAKRSLLSPASHHQPSPDFNTAPKPDSNKPISNWQHEIQTDRAKSFALQLKTDTSQWALKPQDPELLETMCL